MTKKFEMAFALAKEGRSEGVKYLYEHTCKTQICAALDYVGDKDSAAKVIQEAYEQVFAGIDQVECVEQFEPWVSDMVAYFAGQILRERSASAFMETGEYTYRLTDDDMDITEVIDDDVIEATFSPEEIDRMMTVWMADLSDEERICILLHYQENKSVAQMAQILGCTEMAVGSWTASGKQKILTKTEWMQQQDARVRKEIPFFLSVKRAHTKKLIASGALGVLAITSFSMVGTAASAGGAGTSGMAASVGAVGSAGAAGSVGIAGSAGVAGSAGATGSAGVAGSMGAAGSSGVAGGVGMAGSSATGAATLSNVAGGQAIAAATAKGAGSLAGAAIKQGFIHTVLGKVTVGVAAAAVAGGTTAGVVHYNSQRQADKAETPVATVTDATPMDATMTDSITEVTTEEVVNDEYKKIYLAVLQDHESEIRSYDQERQVLGNDEWSENQQVSAPVAVEDITGDGVPELIYIYNMDEEQGYFAGLTIYTVVEGKAKLIYQQDSWDNKVAGGSTYALFQVEGESELYACNGMEDSFTEEDYYRFDVQDDGSLVRTDVMSRYREEGYSATNYEWVETCKVDGAEVSSESFQNSLDALTSRMTKVLSYNRNARDGNARNAMMQAQSCYLTYDQAVSKLSEGLEETAPEEEPAETSRMPFDSAQTLYFMSGAGAWSTELVMNPDGTFTGNYHDMDMGDSGDGYDSTMYICNFTGKFKNIQKKDEYTYTMELDTLTQSETQTEWIEEVEGTRIRFISSGAYGIQGGKTFELYLVGKQVSDLSQEYIGWVQMTGVEENGTLPGYGLYNVEQQNGFFGW